MCDKLFIVYGKWFIKKKKLYNVNEKWYIMYEKWYIVYGKWYIMYGKLYVMCGKWYIMYGKSYLMCGKWYIMYVMYPYQTLNITLLLNCFRSLYNSCTSCVWILCDYIIKRSILQVVSGFCVSMPLKLYFTKLCLDSVWLCQ